MNTKRLEDYTPEEIQDKASQLARSFGEDAYWSWINPIREEAFERLAASMLITAPRDVQTVIEEYAAAAQKVSKKCQVYKNALTPVAALAVLRYGEDVGFWPASFNVADANRALEITYRKGRAAPFTPIMEG